MHICMCLIHSLFSIITSSGSIRLHRSARMDGWMEVFSVPVSCTNASFILFLCQPIATHTHVYYNVNSKSRSKIMFSFPRSWWRRCMFLLLPMPVLLVYSVLCCPSHRIYIVFLISHPKYYLVKLLLQFHFISGTTYNSYNYYQFGCARFGYSFVDWDDPMD